jgi:hypothetical protein
MKSWIFTLLDRKFQSWVEISWKILQQTACGSAAQPSWPGTLKNPFCSVMHNTSMDMNMDMDMEMDNDLDTDMDMNMDMVTKTDMDTEMDQVMDMDILTV